MIICSFCRCGISVEVDGSEDETINIEGVENYKVGSSDDKDSIIMMNTVKEEMTKKVKEEMTKKVNEKMKKVKERMRKFLGKLIVKKEI